MTDKDFEKAYNESDKLEQASKTKKQFYAVIRLADGNGFKSSSYAKVVDASILKPTDLNTIAMLGDKRVYVQNVGDKDYCEQIEKRIKSILDYRNIGEDW
jgi:isopentenyl diphosphate isomerase/L-lactate dehydrogenase-like FMN-dependent dehydrogenase